MPENNTSCDTHKSRQLKTHEKTCPLCASDILKIPSVGWLILYHYITNYTGSLENTISYVGNTLHCFPLLDKHLHAHKHIHCTLEHTETTLACRLLECADCWKTGTIIAELSLLTLPQLNHSHNLLLFDPVLRNTFWNPAVSSVVARVMCNLDRQKRGSLYMHVAVWRSSCPLAISLNNKPNIVIGIGITLQQLIELL